MTSEMPSNNSQMKSLPALPESLSRLQNSYIVLDKLCVLLQKQRVSLNIDILKQYKDLFSVETFRELQVVCSNTIRVTVHALSGIETIELHPPGLSDAKSNSRINAVLKSLIAVAKKAYSEHTGLNESLKEFKLKWARVEKEGWPEGLEISSRFTTTKEIPYADDGMMANENKESACAVLMGKREFEIGDSNDSFGLIANSLKRIRELHFYKGQIVHTKILPPRIAVYRELAFQLPAILHKALINNLRIEPAKFYAHQAIAIDAIRAASSVAISTSTSSGKSLIYNIPILEHCLANPDTTALYLFPTKALAQDQLRALDVFCGQKSTGNVLLPVISCCLDGDTSYSDRQTACKVGGGNIILSNPDMLHSSLMPEHSTYARIFRNLRYVVIDESHHYKGAFGAHVSAVLKRLVRVCQLYQGETCKLLQFILCSATIENPQDLLYKLTPQEFLSGKVVTVGLEDEGSPCGERYVCVWNPPLKDVTKSCVEHYEDAGNKRKIDHVESTPCDIDLSAWQRRAEFSPDYEGMAEPTGFLPHSEEVPRAVFIASTATATAPSDDLAMQMFLDSAECRVKKPVSFKALHPRKPGGSSISSMIPTCRRELTDDNKTLNNARLRVSSITETAQLLVALLYCNLRVICFAGTRKLVELILARARHEIRNGELRGESRVPLEEEHIYAYRGGYSLEERRNIEKRLFQGELKGVVATCALELGVDIGTLDATITLGYPGTISSFKQQMGRAGRRGNQCLSFFVCFECLIDQYFARRPEFLLGQSEPVMLNVENLFIVRGHIACASKEIMLNSLESAPNEENEGGFISANSSIRTSKSAEPSLDYKMWGKSYVEAVQNLVHTNVLIANDAFRAGMMRHSSMSAASIVWRYGNAGKADQPARRIALRLIDPITISVIDTATGKMIDSMGYSRSFFECFQGAVVCAQGKAYLIDDLSLTEKIARCHAERVSYHTVAQNFTEINIVKPLEILSISLFEYGIVQVVSRVHGFNRVANNTGEVLEFCQLNLPALELETRACWINIPTSVCVALEQRNLNRFEAIHTVNHILQAIASLTCQADGDVDTEHFPTTMNQRVLLYDKRPGGLGFCESLLEREVETVDKAILLLESCECRKGCPSCLFSSTCSCYNRNLSKKGGLALLKLISMKMGDERKCIRDDRSDLESPRKKRRENLQQISRFPLARENNMKPSIIGEWTKLPQ